MKTNESSTEAGAERPGASIAEKIKWLETCRTALDAQGIAVLGEVFPAFMREQYEPIRLRILRWHVPEHDAPDLAQEIFFAFRNRVRDHGVKSTLLTTLGIVARGQLLHDARARRLVPEIVCLPPASALPESAVDVERALHVRRLARELFSMLSPKHQAVIERCFLLEQTDLEAAAALGLAEGTLKSRLRAAIRALFALAAQRFPASQRTAA